VLARSSFLLLLPGLAVTTACCLRPVTARSLIVRASTVVAIACFVASPWWVRNCIVLRDFMPLGTQGGFNLPDEDSDVAVKTGGVWSGLAMRQVWAQRFDDTTLMPYLRREGFPQERRLRELWPGGEPGFGWMIYAMTSGQILLERELAITGRNAAIDWI